MSPTPKSGAFSTLLEHADILEAVEMRGRKIADVVAGAGFLGSGAFASIERDERFGDSSSARAASGVARVSPLYAPGR